MKAATGKSKDPKSRGLKARQPAKRAPATVVEETPVVQPRQRVPHRQIVQLRLVLGVDLAAGAPRQSEIIDAKGYGLFRVEGDGRGQTGRLEVFAKRGAAALFVTLGAAGTGRAAVLSMAVGQL
jgi:hypothetical protein